MKKTLQSNNFENIDVDNRHEKVHVIKLNDRGKKSYKLNDFAFSYFVGFNDSKSKEEIEEILTELKQSYSNWSKFVFGIAASKT